MLASHSATVRQAAGRPARDPFLDVIRAGAIVTIVGLHWLMPVVAFQDGTLTAANALAVPGGWLVTWICQVMPLIFFAGGAAAAISIDGRHRRVSLGGGEPGHVGTRWVANRLERLVVPLLPLVIVWLPLPHLLLAVGVPGQPVAMAAELVGRLLWFLAAYVCLVALGPLLARLDARVGWGGVVACAAGAVVVDIVRFGWLDGIIWPGYLNVALVWGAFYLAGMRYGRHGWTGRPQRAVAIAIAGLAVTMTAVAAGPYPPSMIGMPGEPLSNMNPPTAVLLAVGASQLGLVLAARSAVVSRAERPPVEALVRWISARAMTIYLWHTPALVIVAGVAVLGFGFATPEPFGPDWRGAVPLWLAALTGVLAALAAVFGRWEMAAPSASARPRMVTTAVAAALATGALLTWTVVGFSPAAGTWPLAAAGCLAAAVGLTSGRIHLLAGWPRGARHVTMEV